MFINSVFLGPYENYISLAIGLGPCDLVLANKYGQNYCTTPNSKHNLCCFFFPLHGNLEGQMFFKRVASKGKRSLDIPAIARAEMLENAIILSNGCN